MYATYYRENWKEVRATKEHEEFFAKRLSDQDESELIELIRRYREVMESVKWRL
jgi:hypothetical protein